VTDESAPRPIVGEDVYIPSELFLWHGRDDFAGGLCRIARVTELLLAGRAVPFVEVEEQPGSLHNWEDLLRQQGELRARYGDRRGHADPDWRPEFNDG
jgi:hypothetical protein